jgi:hypothetical protein
MGVKTRAHLLQPVGARWACGFRLKGTLRSCSMKSGLLLGAALLATVASSGCGPNVNSLPATAGPTTISPLLLPFRTPQISGQWGGNVTLTGIAGGAGAARSAGALQCAGREFSAAIGESNDHTLDILQADITRPAITARLRSAGTGLACSYTGNLGANNTLSLDATAGATCVAPRLFLRCSEIIIDEDGEEVTVEEVVQLELVGSTISATYDTAGVNVTAIRGTAAHTYNIYSDDNDPLGGLVANHSFDGLFRR